MKNITNYVDVARIKEAIQMLNEKAQKEFYTF